MWMRFFFSLFVILSVGRINAAGPGEILDDDIAGGADAFVLSAEAKLFDTIRKGVALSLAQCEGIDLCNPAVTRDELERIISTLDTRIGSLSQRYEETGETDLEAVLISYADSRTSYSEFLDKLGTMVVDEPETGADLFADDDFLGEDESMDYDALFSDMDEEFMDDLEEDEDLGEFEDDFEPENQEQ